jgi:hypothetical protein
MDKLTLYSNSEGLKTSKNTLLETFPQFFREEGFLSVKILVLLPASKNLIN